LKKRVREGKTCVGKLRKRVGQLTYYAGRLKKRVREGKTCEGKLRKRVGQLTYYAGRLKKESGKVKLA
jgi:hypothetical protein